MSLRQLSRRLRPGTLSGFWQGRYNIQPWNEVASSQGHQQQQQQQASHEGGNGSFSNVTNPSIGLDSVYQKHVYSRLGPPAQAGADAYTGNSSGSSSGAPGGEGGSTLHDAGDALAAAAAFATLHPGAAEALSAGEEEEPGKGGWQPAAALLCDGQAHKVDGQAHKAVIASLSTSTALLHGEAPADSLQPPAPQGAALQGAKDAQGALRIPAVPETAAAPAAEPACAQQPPALQAASPDSQGEGAASSMQAAVAIELVSSKELMPDRAAAPDDDVATTVGVLWTVPEDAVSDRCPPRAQRAAGAKSGNGQSRRAQQRPAVSSSIQPAHAPGYTGRPPEKAAAAAEGKARKKGGRGKARRARQAAEQAAEDSSRAGTAQQAGKEQPAGEAAATGAAPVEGPSHGRGGEVDVEVGRGGEGALRPAAGELARTGAAVPASLAAASADSGFAAAAVAAAPDSMSAPASELLAAAADDWSLPAAAAVMRPAAHLPACSPLVVQPPPQAAVTAQPLQAPAREGEPIARCQGAFLDTAGLHLAALLDEGTLQEDAAVTAGVLTGRGSVAGRAAYVFCLAPDLAAAEGGSCTVQARRVCSLIDRAVLAGAPVVGLHLSHSSLHSGRGMASGEGSRRVELASAEAADWAPVMLSQMDASGVIPQLSAQLGPNGCSPALLQAVPDVSFVVSPPQQRCTGRDARSLMGSAPSSSNSGVSSAVCAIGQVCSLLRSLPAPAAGGLLARLGICNSRRCTCADSQGSSDKAVEPQGQQKAIKCNLCGGEQCSSAYSGGVRCGSSAEALRRLRALLALLPSSNAAPAPTVGCSADSKARGCPLLDAAAATLRAGRAVRAELLIRSIADQGNFLQTLQAAPPASCAAHAAPDLAAGFCRLGGRAVGVLAAPAQLFCSAAFPALTRAEVARLVRFCDAYNLPLVTLLLPGLPASGGESGCAPAGGARTLANLLFAYAEASTPKLTVLTAGAECWPITQCLRSDVTLAWTSAAAAAATGAAEAQGEGNGWRLIRPSDSRRQLCAALGPLLRDARVVACPRRKHALLPL